MKPYTYLIINFLTVIVCFIFSFDRRIQFHKQFPAFIKAAVLVAVPFIVWDSWFTRLGVWWFNPDYTVGWEVAGLPLEECLFFICIPFSCVFTFFCFEKFFHLDWAAAFNTVLVFVSVIGCVTMALVHADKLYTFVTAIVTALTLIYLHFFARVDWIAKASIIFFSLLLGFFPVNGVLTGTGLESPIVNYRANDFLNIRMLTIPVEDAVYGYTLFLLNIYFFKLFQQKTESNHEKKVLI